MHEQTWEFYYANFVLQVLHFFILYLFYAWQNAALAMDESVLDVDQVENLIKFCPTKEEMELLKVELCDP